MFICIGLVSVTVARDLGARSVVGIDIDKGLVETARQRLRRSSKEFPPSMPIVYGPLDVPGVQEANTFPHNLTFVQVSTLILLLIELTKVNSIIVLALMTGLWGKTPLEHVKVEFEGESKNVQFGF